MWKTYNFVCKKRECKEYDIIFEDTVKDKEKDSQTCSCCGSTLDRLLGVGAIKTNDNAGRMKI